MRAAVIRSAAKDKLRLPQPVLDALRRGNQRVLERYEDVYPAILQTHSPSLTVEVGDKPQSLAAVERSPAPQSQLNQGAPSGADLWIAREARWLLDHPSGGNPPEGLRARYHSLLFARSLATYSGVIWMRGLQAQIRNFYSEELLTQLHCRLGLRGNWL